VAALLVSVFRTGHAHGEYDYDYAPTTWIPADGVPVTLASFPLWCSAGAKLFVNSRLQADSPNARMLVGVGVRRRPASAPDDDKKDFLVWRPQNIENIPGNNAFVLRERGIFMVPASGWYTCLLSVTNRNRSALDDPGPCTTNPDYCYRICGADNTWLSALDVDAWAVQSMQSARVLLEPGQAYDVAVLNFTAPTGVTSFRATSDIQFTNCYSSYKECNGPYDPVGASIVSTKLQVMQKAIGGGYCQITNYPSSRLPSDHGWLVRAS